ncbi:MAG TPA: hypothetical protein VKU38_01340 [Ktedonobacteraceae bacterium]|nr:hypothetical protein [Ktedonobacteraceae bacterium]
MTNETDKGLTGTALSLVPEGALKRTPTAPAGAGLPRHPQARGLDLRRSA